MNFFRVVVMFIHIGGGIVWIGGIVYLRVILLPALQRAAPSVRGPLMADVGPNTVRFILRVAEVTILAGVLNVLLMGRVTRIEGFFTTTWGLAILFGFLGSILIYGLGQRVTRPTTLEIASTIKAVAEGKGPADAPARLARLATRQRNTLSIQMGAGLFVVLCMAVARFS